MFQLNIIFNLAFLFQTDAQRLGDRKHCSLPALLCHLKAFFFALKIFLKNYLVSLVRHFEIFAKHSPKIAGKFGCLENREKNNGGF